MIKLKNINVSINSNNILNDISVIINQGEKVAIIGPSGAGKTTLLNLLCKQQSSFTGDFYLNEKNICEYENSKKFANEVGIIRQQFDLVEPLSVINNVLVGRLKDWSFFKSVKSLILPQDKEIALKALSSVRLSDRVHFKTENLSGGEKQRVAIARLLVQNPKIVLADEPIASLDPSLSEEIISLLMETTNDKTLIVSIHSVDYAIKYFDRIIGLKEGKVFFDTKSDYVNSEMINNLYER